MRSKVRLYQLIARYKRLLWLGTILFYTTIHNDELQAQVADWNQYISFVILPTQTL
jgi:hypothetical protein